MANTNQPLNPEVAKRFDEKFEMFDGTLAKRDGQNWSNVNTEDIKSFLASELERQKEEMVNKIKAVKVITPNVEPPPNTLSQNQIFAGGQVSMHLRILEAISGIKNE